MLLTLSEILLTASEILPTPSATNFIEYKGRKYKDGKQGRSVVFLVYLSEIFLSPNRGRKTWRVFINRTRIINMSEDTRTILKKLMRDALDEKDRQRLLCDPKVEERMRSQWDEAADRVNPVVGNRMWNES